MPFFSVIIPVYNVEEYLNTCIQSVLDQTYDDFEIIAVNDGSTDGSLDILEALAANNPRIHIYTTENNGLSATRNFGITQCTGEYMLFLDSDDLLKVHLLEDAFNNIHKHALDMFIYSADSFSVPRNPLLNQAYRHRHDSLHRVLSGTDFFCNAIKHGCLHPSACLYTIKKKHLENITFLPNVLHEDNLFTPQILLSGTNRRVLATNTAYYQRRVHENSITGGGKTVRHTEGLFNVYLSLVDWINTGMLDKAAKHALRKWINTHCLFYLHTLYQAGVKPSESRLKTVFRHPASLLDYRILITLLSPRGYFFLTSLLRKR